MTDPIQPELFSADPADVLPLAAYAERAYLDYAISVVRGRALPELADGQKPVQRRILYAMQAMGLGSGAKPVKSARVVGDVLGKFHPHGDQAAYDALVRMAQSFSLRYPLIDGQGNFGSRDGDGAAAMRYTEARLTPMARLLLDELDEGTVDFQSNYDGSMQEPVLLPARLPMVMLNGASGIAVGMATEIPPHNLKEVAALTIALLRNPSLPDQEMRELLPGPDYPGGAQLISSTEDIAAVYRNGKGSLKLRARAHFEDLARGQWQWVVDELPPGTSAQKVLEEIEEITNPKVKAGRKALTAEQQQSKAAMLTLLESVRDESGKDAAVRLVFEPRSSRQDRDTFVRALLAQTSLEGSASVNLVMIGLDGRPRQKDLRQIVLEWIDFRRSTLQRRSRHRLDRALDRIHVLEGRLVVHLNVDEVIQTIRESDEPRAALMQRFALSERQAEDILEMRLRQLARLEGIRIERELAELRGQAEELQGLLDDPQRLKRLMIKEIEADAKAYGDARRTLIEPAERAAIERTVVDEPVTVIVSQKGWLRARQGHGHDAAQFSFKTGDSLQRSIQCRTPDTLLVLTDQGRVHSISVSALPSARGDGAPVASLIDLAPGSQVIDIFAGPADSVWCLATRGGLGFATTFAEMVSRQKAGRQFVDLAEGDALLPPVLVPPGSTHLACLSSAQRLLVFELPELKRLSAGGRGTQLMALESNETLVQRLPIGPEGLKVTGISRQKPVEDLIRGEALQAYMGKRARKGKPLQARGKPPVLQTPT